MNFCLIFMLLGSASWFYQWYLFQQNILGACNRYLNISQRPWVLFGQAHVERILRVQVLELGYITVAYGAYTRWTARFFVKPTAIVALTYRRLFSLPSSLVTVFQLICNSCSVELLVKKFCQSNSAAHGNIHNFRSNIAI